MRRIALLCLGLVLAACGAESTAPADGAGHWEARAALPEPRQEHGAAELGGWIYIVGGMNGLGVTLASVAAYDPQQDQWRAVADLPQPVHHPGVAAASGRLYVLGGFDLLTPAFVALGTVYEYNPVDNRWRSRSAMPAGSERGAAAVAVIDGRIYVAGGQRNQQAVTDFAVYDPASDQWTSLPPLPTAREHLVGAALGGRFHAIGGRSGALHGENEVYDPVSQQWSTAAPLPTPRGGGGSGVVDGRILVVGGEGNDASPAGVFDQVESYDPATDRWRTLTPMPVPRHGLGVVGYQGRLHVLGGADREVLGPTTTNDALIP